MYDTIQWLVSPLDVIPVWILVWCFLKYFEDAKLLSQYEQLYGFSPVWSLMWVFREKGIEKHFPQKGQLCGFSPVWPLRWTFRYPFCVKRAGHIEQQYGLSPVWTRWWITKSAGQRVKRPQTEQVRSFFLSHFISDLFCPCLLMGFVMGVHAGYVVLRSSALAVLDCKKTEE